MKQEDKPEINYQARKIRRNLERAAVDWIPRKEAVRRMGRAEAVGNQLLETLVAVIQEARGFVQTVRNGVKEKGCLLCRLRKRPAPMDIRHGAEKFNRLLDQVSGEK